MSWPSFSCDQHDGPIVHTIFVLRVTPSVLRMMLSSLADGASVRQSLWLVLPISNYIVEMNEGEGREREVTTHSTPCWRSPIAPAMVECCYEEEERSLRYTTHTTTKGTQKM